ncbi:MAG: SRPBCC domain-containing protein [Bacteroidetes bacterium]|nr:SRPBCC domain-containing protein [Bacteroidota bacterium]
MIQTPETVLNAFMDFDMLNGWWGVEKALVEKREGGVYALVWDISESGFRYVATGIIKSYKADAILEIENYTYLNLNMPIMGPMGLIIEAIVKNNQTELTITQTGYQSGGDWDWYYDAVKQAWPDVLASLKEYLEPRVLSG